MNVPDSDPKERVIRSFESDKIIDTVDQFAEFIFGKMELTGRYLYEQSYIQPFHKGSIVKIDASSTLSDPYNPTIVGVNNFMENPDFWIAFVNKFGPDRHTKEFINRANKICDIFRGFEVLDNKDRVIINLAALAHDWEQNRKNDAIEEVEKQSIQTPVGNNEYFSAIALYNEIEDYCKHKNINIEEFTLNGYDFKYDLWPAVKALIYDTTPVFDQSETLITTGETVVSGKIMRVSDFNISKHIQENKVESGELKCLAMHLCMFCADLGAGILPSYEQQEISTLPLMQTAQSNLLFAEIQARQNPEILVQVLKDNQFNINDISNFWLEQTAKYQKWLENEIIYQYGLNQQLEQLLDQIQTLNDNLANKLKLYIRTSGMDTAIQSYSKFMQLNKGNQVMQVKSIFKLAFPFSNKDIGQINK